LNFIQKLIKVRNEFRVMGMTRAEAEEIAEGIIERLPRKARRSAARKIRNKK
jgi:hypothetical protein